MVRDLSLAAALLGAGFFMVFHPEAFLALVQQAAGAVRNFERQLQNTRWRQWTSERVLPARSSRAAVRLCGLAFAILAVLRLATLG